MPSQPISENQYNKLLEETRKERNEFVRLRDELMYVLSWHLGLRPMELRCIKICHIDLNEKTLFIPAEHNKERHEDYVPLKDELIKKIKDYLINRKIESVWLFPCFHNKFRHRDLPVHARTHERNFTERMRRLGFLNMSFLDGQNKPRYNFNLYSIRKRFGTRAYIKFNHDPQKTANVLRHYDRTFRSIWNYVIFAEKERRRELMNEL